MIEPVNDKCIVFNKPFTSEDGLYHWIQGVKYGITGQDDKFYYLYRKNLPTYKISKELEFVAYNLITPQDKKLENNNRR